jgi:hypothetical protein
MCNVLHRPHQLKASRHSVGRTEIPSRSLIHPRDISLILALILDNPPEGSQGNLGEGRDLAKNIPWDTFDLSFNIASALEGPSGSLRIF